MVPSDHMLCGTPTSPVMSRRLFLDPLEGLNASSLPLRASATQIVVPSDQMPRGTDRPGIVSDRPTIGDEGWGEMTPGKV